MVSSHACVDSLLQNIYFFVDAPLQNYTLDEGEICPFCHLAADALQHAAQVEF
jgi:hypothetical protein